MASVAGVARVGAPNGTTDSRRAETADTMPNGISLHMQRSEICRSGLFRSGLVEHVNASVGSIEACPHRRHGQSVNRARLVHLDPGNYGARVVVAVALLGLGWINVRLIPVDDAYRMGVVDALEAAIVDAGFRGDRRRFHDPLGAGATSTERRDRTPETRLAQPAQIGVSAVVECQAGSLLTDASGEVEDRPSGRWMLLAHQSGAFPRSRR